MRNVGGRQTIDRALRLLEAFPHDRPEISMTELAAATGLERSGVCRMLQALREHRFVAQDPVSRRYSLGPRLFELGSRVAIRVHDGRVPVFD